MAVAVLALDEDDVLVDGVLRPVDVRDEVADTAFVVELLRLPAGALVADDDAETACEKRRLAQALRQRRRVELGLIEDLRVGKERDRGPRLVLRRHADRFHRARRLAACERLAVHLPVASHFGNKPFGERVDHGNAHAVEAPRHLVAIAAELPAGVELREYDCQRRQPLLIDHVDRDARSSVLHRHGIVRVDRHVDEVVATGEGLIDGVVDHLVDEVVEASRARRADVHAGSQAHRLEAFEDRDVLCGIGCFCH